MAEKKDRSDYLFYPQGFLMHYLAYSTPNDGPEETSTPLGFLDPRLKISRLGAQSFVTLAKLKGGYFPEALMSTTNIYEHNPLKMDKFFFNIDNHKLSALVPEIRIMKLDEETGDVIPFYFPIVSDYNYLAGGKMIDITNSFTANAATIESFSITEDGKNPFQASRSYLSADLTVKVDNIAMIFDVPKVGGHEYSAIADLFTIRSPRNLHTPGSNKESPGGVLENGRSCRIIVTLGYAPPLGTDIFTSKEKRLIKQTYKVISLSYSNHDLSLNQDGSATISVKYKGNLESLKGEAQFDLISAVSSKARLQKAKVGAKEEEKPKQDISQLTSKTKQEDEKEKGTKKDEILMPDTGDIINSFGQIIDTLYSTAKIHIVPTGDAADRRRMMLKTQETGEEENEDEQEQTKRIEEIKKLQDEEVNTTWVAANLNSFTVEEAQQSGINPFEFFTKSYISYFTIGDLLDAYCKKIGTDLVKVQAAVVAEKPEKLSDDTKTKVMKRIAKLKEELSKMNILMADIIYTKKQEDSTTPEDRRMNISDIPISVDTFYTAVFDYVTKLRKPFYDMEEFISSFIPKLLARSFGELPGADYINPIEFVTTTYTSRALPKEAIASDGKMSVADLPSSMGSISKKKMKNLNEYIIIHQKPSTHTRSLGKGDKQEDLLNGIYHIRANQNSGIIKNITFSRLESPARQAYMVARNGAMYEELRYAHNAKVEMFGNNLFRPLMSVYINPDSLGFGDPRSEHSAARRLGFGGYYAVGPVTTTFSSNGELSTVMDLYYNAWPSEEKNQSKSRPSGKKGDIKKL